MSAILNHHASLQDNALSAIRAWIDSKPSAVSYQMVIAVLREGAKVATQFGNETIEDVVDALLCAYMALDSEVYPEQEPESFRAVRGELDAQTVRRVS